MKEIQLTQGKVALIDDDDFEKISVFNWYFHNGYAKRMSSRAIFPRRKIYMHREIMNPPSGMEVDHINGDGLDNQKNNLRICNHSQNIKNTRLSRKNNTSGFKGVYKHTQTKKWVARISVDGKTKHLGIFNDVEEAAKEYDKSARLLYGEYANLNFPE